MNWTALPAHASVCLALAPSWYVPLLLVSLILTVADYVLIGVVLARHGAGRRLPFARYMALLYAAFVFTCGLSHGAAVLSLLYGGWAYALLIAAAMAMGATSTAAAIATLYYRTRADAIGARIDELAGAYVRNR